MEKILKIISVIMVVIVVILGIMYFRTGSISPGGESRTLYTGFVKIQPVSLTDVKMRLEQADCHTIGYTGATQSRCFYQDEVVPFENKNGVVVHPKGIGSGPTSFYITEDTIWSTKDLSGAPDQKKFEDAVRQDVASIGNIVQIEENSWEITETKHPYDVAN